MANDSITCTTEADTVSFSIPLTAAGATSGTEMSTLSGSISGCTVSGPVTVTGTVTGSISGTISNGKAGSAKKPCCTTGSLLGTNKEKGTLTVTWSGGSIAIPATSIALKTVTGGLDPTETYATLALAGKESGSFGGSDKGKTSSISAQTDDSVTTLAGLSSISSLTLNGGATGITLK